LLGRLAKRDRKREEKAASAVAPSEG